MVKRFSNLISLDEINDSVFGLKGTPERDRMEQSLINKEINYEP